jgi:hypothetical protein
VPPIGQLQTIIHGPGVRGTAKAGPAPAHGRNDNRQFRLSVGGNRRATLPPITNGSARGRAAGAVRPPRGRI